MSGRTEGRDIERDMARKFAGSRILLVEDDKISRMVAQELLARAGMLVDTAPDGREALRMLENACYDLVLMDIQMPVMDGLTATRKIREQERFAFLPVIAMTAHAMAHDEEACLAAGMNAHIAKPVNSKFFFHCLAVWLRKNWEAS